MVDFNSYSTLKASRLKPKLSDKRIVLALSQTAKNKVAILVSENTFLSHIVREKMQCVLQLKQKIQDKTLRICRIENNFKKNKS